MSEPIIWKGRVCKVSDPPGNFLMSAVHDPENWDFVPRRPNKKQAVAGNVGPGDVTGLRVLDEDHLLIETTCGTYVMTGDPADGGRIDKYEDKK